MSLLEKRLRKTPYKKPSPPAINTLDDAILSKKCQLVSDMLNENPAPFGMGKMGTPMKHGVNWQSLLGAAENGCFKIIKLVVENGILDGTSNYKNKLKMIRDVAEENNHRNIVSYLNRVIAQVSDNSYKDMHMVRPM